MKTINDKYNWELLIKEEWNKKNSSLIIKESFDDKIKYIPYHWDYQLTE